MKILGLIPARGGSKGVPKKNIKLLNGNPLIYYTANVALKSKLLERVIVSTDSYDIANISRKIGLEVPFMRPDRISTDNTPTLDVIIHALNFYKKNNIFFDGVCLLQPTSPLRTLKHLNNCISKFINNKSDSLISVLKVPHKYNPYWTFEEDNPGELSFVKKEKIINRRQDLPNIYYRDGSIYITNTKTILEDKSIYGNKITFVLNPSGEDINIDTVDDWNKAELFFKNQ